MFGLGYGKQTIIVDYFYIAVITSILFLSLSIEYSNFLLGSGKGCGL